MLKALNAVFRAGRVGQDERLLKQACIPDANRKEMEHAASLAAYAALTLSA
jgi:hypothetical protein